MSERDRVAGLVDRLKEELARPEDQRESAAPTYDLGNMIARIADWLKDGNALHLEGIARMVTDGWSLTSPLSAEVVELEQRHRARPR